MIVLSGTLTPQVGHPAISRPIRHPCGIYFHNGWPIMPPALSNQHQPLPASIWFPARRSTSSSQKQTGTIKQGTNTSTSLDYGRGFAECALVAFESLPRKRRGIHRYGYGHGQGQQSVVWDDLIFRLGPAVYGRRKTTKSNGDDDER